MGIAEVHWRPLGTLLVERGLLSAEELEDALEAQRETGKRLGEILVERGLISHPALSDALAHQYGIELSSESGFGTGLRALIEQRHSESRPGVLPSIEETGESAVETAELDLDGVVLAPGRLIALEPQLEEHWARLASAEARAADRDAVIEALEQERAERVFAAAAQTKALNRRLGAVRKELAERERKAASLTAEIGIARVARAGAAGDLETVRAEFDNVQRKLVEGQGELQKLQAEVAGERDHRDATAKDRDELVQRLEERLQAAVQEHDQEQAQARQLRDELNTLQAELDSERLGRQAADQDRAEAAERLRDDAGSLRSERDALAAELAEARTALASAQEQAGRHTKADSAREEQGHTVETIAVVLDEIRRERDAAREAHSEAQRRLAQLERDRDEQARALAEATATAVEHEARVQDLEQELQRRLGELGSAHDERGKLAQLVKRLGDEQAARQHQLAEAAELADRQRRRADELTEEAARQVEQEREERAHLVPRLEELQRDVAASEQRLATAAVQVLGERRRQDDERRRAEAAEAAARRYKHRLSELEQSGAQPA